MKLTLFLSLLSAVSALPGGSPGCRGDDHAAVGHPGEPGSFAEGTFELLANGDVVSADMVMFIEAGAPVILTVQAADGTPMRGAFVRAEASDDQEIMLTTEDPNYQNANACSLPVVAITHTDRSEKLFVTGTMMPPDSGTVTLDITVVVSNNANEGSIFYYDQFLLFVDATDETEPPAAEPTAMPVTAETSVPTTGATTMPTVSPTETEETPPPTESVTTEEPTPSPTETEETPAPTASPTETEETASPTETEETPAPTDGADPTPSPTPATPGVTAHPTTVEGYIVLPPQAGLPLPPPAPTPAPTNGNSTEEMIPTPAPTDSNSTEEIPTLAPNNSTNFILTLVPRPENATESSRLGATDSSASSASFLSAVVVVGAFFLWW